MLRSSTELVSLNATACVQIPMWTRCECFVFFVQFVFEWSMLHFGEVTARKTQRQPLCMRLVCVRCETYNKLYSCRATAFRCCWMSCIDYSVCTIAQNRFSFNTILKSLSQSWYYFCSLGRFLLRYLPTSMRFAHSSYWLRNFYGQEKRAVMR